MRAGAPEPSVFRTYYSGSPVTGDPNTSPHLTIRDLLPAKGSRKKDPVENPDNRIVPLSKIFSYPSFSRYKRPNNKKQGAGYTTLEGW
jgi:hypothetical protein